jgi:hypothetical protein
VSYRLTNLCEWAVGDLDQGEKAVLRVLCAYADDDGTNCHPSMKTLGLYACNSESTARRAIERLVARGWITRIGEDWRTCHYTVIVARIQSAFVDPKHPGRPQDPCHPDRADGANTPVNVTPPPVKLTANPCQIDTQSSSGSVSTDSRTRARDPRQIDTRPPADPGKAARELEEAQLAGSKYRRERVPCLAGFRDPLPGETAKAYRAAQDAVITQARSGMTPPEQIRRATNGRRSTSVADLVQAVTPPGGWTPVLDEDSLRTIEIELLPSPLSS